MEVWYNILIEFCTRIKLARLIKMSLNLTYIKGAICKNLSDTCSIQNGLKNERRFVATAFQLYSIIICHYEGQRKLGRAKIQLKTPGPGLC
jgi:hypothetical protein